MPKLGATASQALSAPAAVIQLVRVAGNPSAREEDSRSVQAAASRLAQVAVNRSVQAVDYPSAQTAVLRSIEIARGGLIPELCVLFRLQSVGRADNNDRKP